jgi:hypothetical protein
MIAEVVIPAAMIVGLENLLLTQYYHYHKHLGEHL